MLRASSIFDISVAQSSPLRLLLTHSFSISTRPRHRCRTLTKITGTHCQAAQPNLCRRCHEIRVSTFNLDSETDGKWLTNGSISGRCGQVWVFGSPDMNVLRYSSMTYTVLGGFHQKPMPYRWVGQ